MKTQIAVVPSLTFSLLSGLGCGLFIILIAFAESNIYIIPPAWIRLFSMTGLVFLGLSLVPALIGRAGMRWPLLATLLSLPLILIWAWIRYDNGFPTPLSNGLGGGVTVTVIAVILLTATASTRLMDTPRGQSSFIYAFYSAYALISGAALVHAGFSIAGIDPTKLPRYIAACLLAMIALKGFAWMKAVKAGDIQPDDPMIRRTRLISNGCLVIAAGLQLVGSPWGSLIFILFGIGAQRRQELGGSSR